MGRYFQREEFYLKVVVRLLIFTISNKKAQFSHTMVYTGMLTGHFFSGWAMVKKLSIHGPMFTCKFFVVFMQKTCPQVSATFFRNILYVNSIKNYCIVLNCSIFIKIV
jgi:hypothetical protein